MIVDREAMIENKGLSKCLNDSIIIVLFFLWMLPSQSKAEAPTKFQISGTVKDWRGQSVSNIDVLFNSWAFGPFVDLTNWTDRDGKFYFEVAPDDLGFPDVSVDPQALLERGYRMAPSRNETRTHG